MKRGNENAQQRREDYEAQDDDDDDDDGSNVITPKGPFAKASDELLKSRRILRVSKYSNKATTPAPAVHGNPFAGVKLQAVTTTGTAMTTNPFASLLTNPSSAVTPDDQTNSLLANLKRDWISHYDAHLAPNPEANWFNSIRHYLLYKQAIIAAAATTSTATSSTALLNATSHQESSVATKLSTTVPVATTSPPFANFSFGSKQSSPATISFGTAIQSKSTSFSFAPPAVTPPPPPTTTTNNQSDDNEDDMMPREEPTKVEILVDPDWTENFQFPAQYYKLVTNGGWKSYCQGDIKVESNKRNASKRMIMRDAIGKVQLNLSLSKGMDFKPVRKQTKKAGGKAFIQFVALQDATVGTESFMYQVKPDVLDEVASKLNSMVS